MMRAIDYKMIDIHTHMGPEYPIYYPEHDADSMVKYMDECGVELIVSAPCEDLFVKGFCRNDIVDAMDQYPDRIKGYFAFNPNLPTSGQELEEHFRKHPGYVGLKFLPDYHRTNITDPSYADALAFADEKKLIVLSHTWGLSMNGEQCNSADKIAAILDKYPNIRFIMGHSIQGQTELAIEIAQNYENAYLDLCDTGRFYGMVERMVEAVGAEKVLYATDAPMQGYRFIQGAVLSADITDTQCRMILRDNAAKLLGL
jgi:predicted TIM-barrel fold metal-dependent hydrolase